MSKVKKKLPISNSDRILQLEKELRAVFIGRQGKFKKWGGMVQINEMEFNAFLVDVKIILEKMRRLAAAIRKEKCHEL